MKNIVKIRFSFTTYIFIILLLFSGYKNSLLYISFVFFIHEIGHVFFCNLFNIEIVKLKIYPFGGNLVLNKKINVEDYKDFLVSLGGIIFQFILLLINIIIFKSDMVNYYNLMFLFFNLLPIIPFDGSKGVLIVLSVFFPYYYSYVLYIIISSIAFLLYVIYQVKICNINYFLIFFIFYSTLVEAKKIKVYFNKFLLERYVLKNKPRKCIIHRKVDIMLIRKNRYNFFGYDLMLSETNLLSKKFDNSSYF